MSQSDTSDDQRDLQRWVDDGSPNHGDRDDADTGQRTAWTDPPTASSIGADPLSRSIAFQ
jgi:hypothetical protein